MYRLSGAARRAVAAAEKEALALGHLRLESAHLVLGLMVERGAATAALEKQGLQLTKLRRAVDEQYAGDRGKRERDFERFGGEVREVMELAKDEAEQAGENDIALVRLFLAATADEEWSAYKALRALGIDVERARDEADGMARDEAQGSLPG